MAAAQLEDIVLASDPFAGDFDGSGDSDCTLRDRMVTARKPAKCHDCGREVQPGERCRSRVDVFDGELMSFRWCWACCLELISDAIREGNHG